MAWSWACFFYGAIGAIAPQIHELYKKITSHIDAPTLQLKLMYFAITLIYSILGGIVAVVWGTHTPKECFLAGLATPLILANAAKLFKT